MLPAQAHDFSHFPGCVIGQSKLLEFPLRETILKLIVRCTATCHNDSEINKKVFFLPLCGARRKPGGCPRLDWGDRGRAGRRGPRSRSAVASEKSPVESAHFPVSTFCRPTGLPWWQCWLDTEKETKQVNHLVTFQSPILFVWMSCIFPNRCWQRCIQFVQISTVLYVFKWQYLLDYCICTIYTIYIHILYTIYCIYTYRIQYMRVYEVREMLAIASCTVFYNLFIQATWYFF